MSEFQVTYWREIPSMVVARDGGTTAKVQLSGRFQEAIDAAAMALDLFGSDAYLEAWVRGPWQHRNGAPDEVSEQVAAEIESEYPPARLAGLAAGG